MSRCARECAKVPAPCPAYRTWGSSARPPLLLLHGFMGRSDDWAEIAEALAADFFCIAPDLPGHGRTPFDAVAHRTFGRYARSVLAVLAELRVARSAAIGYSMGGRVLLALAVVEPRLFSRLVLVSSGAGLAARLDRQARWRADRELMSRLRREVPAAFLDWWYGLPLFGAIKTSPGYPAMIKRRLENSPDEVARALGAVSVGRQAPLWSRLSGVQSEALVMCGAVDATYCDIAARMCAASPRFRSMVVPGCSHAVHVERPRPFIEICRAYLVASATVTEDTT